MALVLSTPSRRDVVLHEGEVTVVISRSDARRIPDVAIEWLGEGDRGMLSVRSLRADQSAASRSSATADTRSR